MYNFFTIHHKYVVYMTSQHFYPMCGQLFVLPTVDNKLAHIIRIDSI